MPLFKVTHEWSSLHSTQPKWNEFKPSNRVYNVTFTLQGFIMTDKAGKRTTQGTLSEYPQKPFSREWEPGMRQYHTDSFAGGVFSVFSVFKDGTDGLIYLFHNKLHQSLIHLS